jgi:HTH-type transcriptional repressor of NAD biosynthesis genes
VTRYRRGLVIGKFYPPHAGHHRLIDTAAQACDAVVVVVAPSRAESIPLDLRLAWLREVHRSAAHVRFVGTYDDHPIDYGDPGAWDAHCATFQAATGDVRFDAVFSSEPYGDELARRFRARHVSVDPPRLGVPISGTAIREDPVANWAFLAPPVRAWLTRRVVVLGAESTGTTTIARALARQLRLRGGVWADTQWTPEYGRAHTEIKLAALRAANGACAGVEALTWDRGDFTTVVKEQRATEETAARAGSPVLVCDTDVFATAVWEERYLGSVSAEVAQAARDAAQRADLYLLTSDDGVPFVDDGMRDGEHLRTWMSGRFRAELSRAGVDWVELTGRYRKRLATAVAACDELVAGGWRFAEPLRPSVA